MIWPPQNTGLFEYKTPCCACPADFLFPFCWDFESADEDLPTEVYDTDPTYGFDESRFQSLADAESFRDNYIANCLAGYLNLGFENAGGTWAIDADFASEVLTITSDVTMPLEGFPSGNAISAAVMACLELQAGDVVSIGYDMEAQELLVVLEDISTCGNSLSSFSDEVDSPGSGSIDMPDAAPVDGLYLLSLFMSSAGLASVHSVFTITSTSGLSRVVAPTILYNDGSGNTASLACS